MTAAIPSPSPSAADRLGMLDAIRGIAALIVAWHHFYVIVLHGFPADGPLRTHAAVRGFVEGGRWGVLGVAIFFVLSGFCIGQTWLRSKSWQDFALRRLRRIFPAYLASLGLVVLCAIAAKLIDGTNDIAAFPPLTWQSVVATLSLFTAPASSVPSICWVYWSLTYEVAFYVVLTGALAFPPRARLGVLATASVAFCLLALFPQFSPRPGVLFFCDLWPLFAMGLSIALATQARLAAAWIAVAAPAGIFAVAKNPLYPGFPLAALITVVVVALVASRRAGPRNAVLEWIGDFSYSFYLTHVPIFLLVGRWLLLPARSPLALFAGCAVALGLALGFAWLFCRWFEKPFQRSPRQATQLAPA